MPLYTVMTEEHSLSEDIKSKIAEEITESIPRL